MDQDDNYKRVYTGSEVNVMYLQNLFNEAGISSRTRNDFDSGLRAGFGGGIPPGNVQLFVISSRFEEALKIIEDAFPQEE